MKRRLRLLPLLTLVTIMLTTSLLAQQRRMMSPAARTDSLAKLLSLSEDQKAKVLAIFTASDDSMKAAFAAHQGDRGSMREAMRAIRQDTDKKMKEVLTDEQYTTWLKERPVMGRRRNPPGGGN